MERVKAFLAVEDNTLYINGEVYFHSDAILILLDELQKILKKQK